MFNFSFLGLFQKNEMTNFNGNIKIGLIYGVMNIIKYHNSKPLFKSFNIYFIFIFHLTRRSLVLLQPYLLQVLINDVVDIQS